MAGRESELSIEHVRDLFAADLTKVLLSALILVSVLPFPWTQAFGIGFFALFAVELALRSLIFVDDVRAARVSKVEVVFLIFDLLATLSFLPFEALWNDVRLLRLFRLSRMLLLLGYWGPMVREVWNIVAKRERRYQLAFVAVSIVILAFSSAVILEHFRAKGIDFNGDGVKGDHSFWAMLWWAFVQLESADNIIKDPEVSLGFFFSVFLTVSGVFLFSFLIGIGNSIVEELVTVSKERRIGMRRHSVICNLGPHAAVLLQELITYYAKSFRSPRIITMGSEPRRYDYMHEPQLLRVRYRQGQALSSHDLRKVDADRATRVILLGHSDREVSDSEVISQILSVREVNQSCPIYAELFRPDNVQAAIRAGGRQTVPVMANRLVSLYMANLIVFPGIEEVYHDLVTPQGNEIYTCVYDAGHLAGRQPPSGPLLPFGELLERCHRAHGVVLLGHLLADPAEPTGFSHAFIPGARITADGTRHEEVPAVERVRGFFGVAPTFEHLKAFVASLPDVSLPAEPEPEAAVPSFGVCPGASRIRRFLICGFHDGLVDFCEELILYTRLPEIFLMVPEGFAVEEVLRAFADRPDEPGSATMQGGRLRFTRDGDDELRYGPPAGEALGRLVVLRGDWSDDRTLLAHAGTAASRSVPQGEDQLSGRGYRLEDLDAVLLTYLPGESDPDARTSLALLKLIRLKESGRASAALRLFCEVQHAEKAALFQRRFGAQGCGDAVTVVASESMRNGFLAQAVFVPGSVSIYRELLSQAGVYLCKLLPEPPADPDAALTFGQLLTTLYRRDDCLLVAVELGARDGERRLAVNPAPRSPDYRFRAGELRSIFAIGEFSGRTRSQPCPRCVVQPDR